MNQPLSTRIGRYELVQQLVGLGYSQPGLSQAVTRFDQGGTAEEILATLHPEIARAFRTQTWLNNLDTPAIDAAGELT